MKDGKLYPEVTKENAQARGDAAPQNIAAWRTFSRTVFKAGALDAKTKQLIAVAVAHVTQCPYCIHGHTPQAMKAGATKEEIMEAIWVAAEMRAGAAYAHSVMAMEEIMEVEEAQKAQKADI